MGLYYMFYDIIRSILFGVVDLVAWQESLLIIVTVTFIVIMAAMIIGLVFRFFRALFGR